jgi:hypothetical protein
MVLHRHHHRAHHSVGYIGRSGDEQKIASRHPRSRHGVLASETTVAESPSFYTDCGNIKRFPRRSPLPDVDGWRTTSGRQCSGSAPAHPPNCKNPCRAPPRVKIVLAG